MGQTLWGTEFGAQRVIPGLVEIGMDQPFWLLRQKKKKKKKGKREKKGKKGKKTNGDEGLRILLASEMGDIGSVWKSI